MVKIKELKDFKDTPYYKYYEDMVNSYSIKIIESIISQQGIDNEKKYTRGDVLKEVWKFINSDLREFKDLEEINPSKTEYEREEIDRLLKEQAKGMLGMN